MAFQTSPYEKVFLDAVAREREATGCAFIEACLVVSKRMGARAYTEYRKRVMEANVPGVPEPTVAKELSDDAYSPRGRAWRALLDAVEAYLLAHSNRRTGTSAHDTPGSPRDAGLSRDEALLAVINERPELYQNWVRASASVPND